MSLTSPLTRLQLLRSTLADVELEIGSGSCTPSLSGLKKELEIRINEVEIQLGSIALPAIHGAPKL